MVNRLLVWAAGSPRLQRQITQHFLTRRVAHRFMAGERLDDALAVAVDLNGEGMGGILDLLGEGVTDLAGAAHAVEEYEDAVECDRRAQPGRDDIHQAVPAGADGRPRRLREQPEPDPGPGTVGERPGRDRHGGQRSDLGYAAIVPGRRHRTSPRPAWPSRRRCAVRRRTWRRWRQ